MEKPDKQSKKSKKKKSNKVKPVLLKGFRDYIPAEEIARQRMLRKVSEVFDLMGFLPLQTPSLESADVLLGSHYNEDSLKELFGFEGPDEVDMALRYEFTLSLARHVAANPTLAMPFRRQQFGNVWRVDKPGPGRFREFMQYDIDIVGTANLLADAEIIAAMVTCFEQLGVERFVVRYSTRKLLNGVIEFAGIPVERGPDVMRVIDKLEKQGLQAVLDELAQGRTDASGAKIPGLDLEPTQIEKLKQFLELAAEKSPNQLEKVAEMVGHIGIANQGLDDLGQIQTYLKSLGIDQSKAEIDLTIVRGLGYYTSTVFETTLLDLPDYGSVFSGGRYDNLVERFVNRTFPAVGSSIGIDRLLAALIALKAIDGPKATSKVLVTVMDGDRLPEYLGILKELRSAGIASEIYTGETKNLTKQVKYGDKVGIPIAVIAGSDEFDKGEVTVKNLALGATEAKEATSREEWLKAEGFQKQIPRTELVDYIKNLLQ